LERRIFSLTQKISLLIDFAKGFAFSGTCLSYPFYYGFAIKRFPKIFPNRIYGALWSSVGSVNPFLTLHLAERASGGALARQRLAINS
jgi:hypothetical protein